MKKQYNTKQTTKKQQQSGGITKLSKAHHERGFREKSPVIEFFGLLENKEGKTIVIDATSTYRTGATMLIEAEYANMVAQGKVSSGYQLASVRAYQ